MSDIGSSLPPNSADVQYDAAAKNLTEHLWVLAQIVRHILPELKEKSVDEVTALIDPDIRKRVPIEPGRTNEPAVRGQDPSSRIMGLQTEDKPPNEGEMVFDFVFSMQIPGQDGLTAVILNVEPMRQLSKRYKLGARKQVAISRLLGSQVGRNITNQHYSAAVPCISIWLCFSREVNTFRYGLFVEEDLLNAVDSDGNPIQDPELEAGESLTNVYTIGFRNAGPAGYEKDNKELFELLAALYSATMERDEKLRILNDQFGLQKAEETEKIEIEEDIQDMSNLEAVIRRDMGAQLRAKDEQLGQKDEQLRVKDEQLGQKDEQLLVKDKTIEEQARELAELRAKVAEYGLV